MTPTQPTLSFHACICGDPNCIIPYGECHCGCGEKTRIPSRTDKRDAQIKGVPMRFVHGHHQIHKRVDTDVLEHFKIDGVYCRLVALSRGLYAIVDEIDYHWINQYVWTARWDGDSNYAQRQEIIGGKVYSIHMHREILGLKYGDPLQGDHIKAGYTLDNRRANLRVSSRNGQMRNRRTNKSNTTGFKGVGPVPNSPNYRARILVDGKRIHLGMRSTPKAAWEELYIPAAKKYFGSFARFK